LIEHPRFRAGLDFLVLRAASGEIDQELADWWTDFFAADYDGREILLAAKPASRRPVQATGAKKAPVKKAPEADDADAAAPSAPRKRRRRPRKPAAAE